MLYKNTTIQKIYKTFGGNLNYPFNWKNKDRPFNKQ